MIPTAANGHMPFISSSTNHHLHRAEYHPPKKLSLGTLTQQNNPELRKSSPTAPTTASLPNGAGVTPGHRGQSPSSPSVGNSLAADAQKMSPPKNGFVQSPPRPILLKQADVTHEDILHKEHSWRAFLRALFRSKAAGKKVNGPTAAPTTTGVSGTVAGTLPNKTKSGKRAVVKRPLTSKLPNFNVKRTNGAIESTLQRSHSMNAAQKTLARLEAIIEEDLNVGSADEIVTNTSSAPNHLERVRPCSAYLERKAMKYLRLSPPGASGWSDSDNSSCESLTDIPQST